MRDSVADTHGICLAFTATPVPPIWSIRCSRTCVGVNRPTGATMFEQFSLGTKAKKNSDQLNEIVLAARHERDALGALFEQLDGRSGKLAEVSTTFEQIKDRAVDASEQLTTIVVRITELDKRVASFELMGPQVAEMTNMV